MPSPTLLAAVAALGSLLGAGAYRPMSMKVSDLRRSPPVSRPASSLPVATSSLDAIRAQCRGKRVLVFLDYDGTLAPIVPNPDEAWMPASVRAAVVRLAERKDVAIVSGRGREKVKDFVKIPGLYYAGSHGFDIAGPDVEHIVAEEALPALNSARDAIAERLRGVAGATVEDNRFSMSVHWRNVAEGADRALVTTVTEEEVASRPNLAMKTGKCVYELRPDTGVEWNKGEAVLYLMDFLLKGDASAASTDGVVPVFVGDDTTDEDAFAVLQNLNGLCMLVTATGDTERPRDTFGTHTLGSYVEVEEFINELAAM